MAGGNPTDMQDRREELVATLVKTLDCVSVDSLRQFVHRLRAGLAGALDGTTSLHLLVNAPRNGSQGGEIHLSVDLLDEEHCEMLLCAVATPPNSKLLEWARRPENQPPQAWFDETEDLFAE